MRIFQVDAFTSKAFSGNPAGVCVFDEMLSDETMQNIAMEMNLSETAFLLKQGKHYNLRWFTPVTEVSLCGHATLSSAHILYELGLLKHDEIVVFNTKSGILHAEKSGKLIKIDLPAAECTEINPPDELRQALGTKIISCAKYRNDVIAELENESIVRNIEPNFVMLRNLIDFRAVAVTSRSKNFDFVSRFFAPKVGVNEDPVTGSAHCGLVPYWAGKQNQTKFKAYQASKRGGILLCELEKDRVKLSGEAITVMVCDMKMI